MDKRVQALISGLTQAQREELAGRLRLLAGQKGNQQTQIQAAASQIALLQLQARIGQPPAFPMKSSLSRGSQLSMDGLKTWLTTASDVDLANFSNWIVKAATARFTGQPFLSPAPDTINNPALECELAWFRNLTTDEWLQVVRLLKDELAHRNPTKASPPARTTPPTVRHPSILGGQPESITRTSRTSVSRGGIHPRATLQERRACGCWLCAK